MFNHQQVVRFDDVDGAGIVYYPRYFNFCHNAFEDFFTTLGPMPYPQIISKLGLGFPAVRVESDFIKPLYYGDAFNVKLEVLSLGNSSLKCQYVISSHEQTQFKAIITTVCMSLSAKKSERIVDNLRHFLVSHLGGST
jgi:4-hydroxybenzoyl-CoA thioesterase